MCLRWGPGMDKKMTNGKVLRMYKSILLLLSLFFCGINPATMMAGPTPTPTPGLDDYVNPEDLKYSGVYEDSYCGFKVTIPKGLEGAGNAPFGHHGIFIPFCKGRDCGGVEIFKGFNSTETVSPGEDAGGMMKVEKEDKDHLNWELLSAKPAEFHSLPVYRVEYRYTSLKTGVKMKCLNLFLLTSSDALGAPTAPPQSEEQMNKDFQAAFENKTRKDMRTPPAYEWMLTLTVEESKFAVKMKIYESVISGLKFFKPTEEK